MQCIRSGSVRTRKDGQTKAWAANDRVHIAGLATIVDAANTAGVGQVVQESGCMLYPDRGAAWIDEDCPPDQFLMAQGDLAAEAVFCRR